MMRSKPYMREGCPETEEPEMRSRCLTINCEFAADIILQLLARGEVKRFEVARYALPEDAKCVGVEVNEHMGTLGIQLTSSVFKDDDPYELASPILQSI